jgi:putative transposase
MASGGKRPCPRANEPVSNARAERAVHADFRHRRRPRSAIDRRTPVDAYFDLPPLAAAA